MSVYKNNRGRWTVFIRYVDWQGKSRVKKKETFLTKREAVEYEREFMCLKSRDIQMQFGSFVAIYMDDMKPRLKRSTFESKQFMIKTHILPYFESKPLAEISSTDVLQWQNVLLSKRDANGKGYSQTYLRSVQNQLTAIFNHAVKYYDLPKSPCFKLDKMGKSKAQEMLFWTKDEYLQFIESMKEKPVSYYLFEVLYWTGIREGELLALTMADFDLEKKTVSISKSYQRLGKEDVITTPKTERSNRIIDLPEFLCEEMEDYFESLYKPRPDDRIFPVTKYYILHELTRGCKETGVKRIRVHDIRHSHVSYLINLGFSPVDIAARMGHESPTVTMNTYAHLYPRKQQEMARMMDQERRRNDDE